MEFLVLIDEEVDDPVGVSVDTHAPCVGRSVGQADWRSLVRLDEVSAALVVDLAVAVERATGLKTSIRVYAFLKH